MMSNYLVDMDGCVTVSLGENYDIVRYLICGKFRSVCYGDNYGILWNILEFRREGNVYIKCIKILSQRYC